MSGIGLKSDGMRPTCTMNSSCLLVVGLLQGNEQIFTGRADEAHGLHLCEYSYGYARGAGGRVLVSATENRKV